MNAPDVLDVFRAIEQISTGTCGAFVRKRVDGSVAGALLVERGRVCWAISERHPRRLTDVLVEVSGELTHEHLNELFAQCRREHLPLGETLVSRGVVALPVLHRALLRHTCEALDSLLDDAASSWDWVQHSGRGYDPMLTFSPAEILAGVQAITQPARAAWAHERLAGAIREGQRGFAVSLTGMKLPLAQIGCEAEDLTRLAEITNQMTEVMTVAMTVDGAASVVELGEMMERRALACASWIEDTVMFVLLREGELAFNQLLAQMATRPLKP